MRNTMCTASARQMKIILGELPVGLLQNMMQVINSYYGTMGHANSYRLRRSLYLNQFHGLQKYFVPGAGFTKMILRPVALLKREGIIAL